MMSEKMRISEAMKALSASRKLLTRQQVCTLKGQIVNGDTEGAMRGLQTIINKRGGKE